VHDILHSGQHLLGLIDGLLESARRRRAAPAGVAGATYPAERAAAGRALHLPCRPSLPLLPKLLPLPDRRLAAGLLRLRVLYIDDNPVNTPLMAAIPERLPGLVCSANATSTRRGRPGRPARLAAGRRPDAGADGYAVPYLLRAARHAGGAGDAAR
jgi:hypothetical protein